MSKREGTGRKARGKRFRPAVPVPRVHHNYLRKRRLVQARVDVDLDLFGGRAADDDGIAVLSCRDAFHFMIRTRYGWHDAKSRRRGGREGVSSRDEMRAVCSRSTVRVGQTTGPGQPTQPKGTCSRRQLLLLLSWSLGGFLPTVGSMATFSRSSHIDRIVGKQDSVISSIEVRRVLQSARSCSIVLVLERHHIRSNVTTSTDTFFLSTNFALTRTHLARL